MLIRALVILLLVLNLGVALWWALSDQSASTAPTDLPPGVERLELVAGTAEPVVPAPEAPADKPIVQCASFGPFRSASMAGVAEQRAQAEGLAAGDDADDGQGGPGVVATAIREAREGTPRSWRVLLPALPSAQESDAVAKRISATGFSDYYVIRDGADANAIALGLFRNESSARDRANTLGKAGFAAVVQPVGAGSLEHWLDIGADGAFDAGQVRGQLAAARTETIDCTRFSTDAAAAPRDLGDNPAAR